MPPANLMTQHIGAMYPLMQQQSSLQNALGNQLQQTNTLSGLLQQQNLFGTPLEIAVSERAIAQQQDKSDALRNYRRIAHIDWVTTNARKAAKEGEKLIDRMAFWSALPFIGDAIAGKLSDKLERVTDEVESFVRLAA